MASRQEEKERRRQERIAREQAEAAAARRKQLALIVAGTVVAAAIVIVVVLSSSGGTPKSPGPQPSPTPTAAIPARKITDLQQAAKAAGCALTNPPIEGRDHVTTKVTYKTNPPTSGNHVPPPELAKDGDYSGVVAPRPEQYVHSLEHGRVIIQYRPGLSKHRIDQLVTLFAESSKTDFGLQSVGGGFTLLLQNNTTMPYDVAATAWGQLLACRTFNPKIFDAIRAFRQRYVLKAPEVISQPE